MDRHRAFTHSSRGDRPQRVTDKWAGQQTTSQPAGPPLYKELYSMDALVLERKNQLALREIDIPESLGPHDVRIAIHTVGICGSDVHYYTHGAIGFFVVKEPMVLGHEASGTVVEVGAEVTNLQVGDRVCMEPGIPDPNSRATRLGMYN